VSPLHYAISRGFTKTAKCLIDNGADISGRTSDHDTQIGGQTQIAISGWTPLHLAAHIGLFPIVQYLIQHGADALVATEPAGKTVLHVTVDAQRMLRSRVTADEDGSELLARLQETQDLLIREEPELLTICDRNGSEPFQTVDRQHYFAIKKDEIAENIKLYNDASLPKRQAAQRFFHDRLLHRVVQDRWDRTVQPHKRRALVWHLTQLGIFSLLVLARFRRHPLFPADEFLEDLQSRMTNNSHAELNGGISGLIAADGKFNVDLVRNAMHASYQALFEDFSSVQSHEGDGYIVLGRPSLTLLEDFKCVGFDNNVEDSSSDGHTQAFDKSSFMDCFLDGHRPGREFRAFGLKALVQLPPANLVELQNDGFMEWILDIVDRHDGTYVALELSWVCTIDSMPQELCTNAGSAAKLFPLAFSHFAKRSSVFQLLLLVCVGFSLLASLRNLHRMRPRARWKPLLVLGLWHALLFASAWVVLDCDESVFPAFVATATLGTRAILRRVRYLDHLAVLQNTSFRLRDLLWLRSPLRRDHDSSNGSRDLNASTSLESATIRPAWTMKPLKLLYSWIVALVGDWNSVVQSLMLVNFLILVAMPFRAKRLALNGEFSVEDVQQGYIMEQFAFGVNISLLWLQTFSCLEGYETVQILLVSIRDMLKALGGFSLILVVTCSSFGMAYFTLGDTSVEWISDIVIGNLHSAVKGDSHDTTDTPAGFILTFLFDISVVLILMSVMESILVALYEKSQENAKMIRCYTQAHQIFSFGLQHDDKEITQQDMAVQHSASHELQRRQESLVRMMKRSFGLLKPLARWRELKKCINSGRFSDTAHPHFFNHFLVLMHSTQQQRALFSDVFSADVLPEIEFFTRRDPEAELESSKLRNSLEFIHKLMSNDESCVTGPDSSATFQDIRAWCVEKFDLEAPHVGLMLIVSTVSWCLGKLSTWSEHVSNGKTTSIDKLCLLQRIMGDHHLYSTMLPTFGMLPAELRRVVRSGFDTGFTFGQLLQLECIEASLTNLRVLASTSVVSRLRSTAASQSRRPPGTAGRSQSPNLLDPSWKHGPGSNASPERSSRSHSVEEANVISGSQSMHLFLFCQTVYMFAGSSGKMLSFLWKMAKRNLVVLDTLQSSSRTQAAVYSDFLRPFLQIQTKYPLVQAVSAAASCTLMQKLSEAYSVVNGPYTGPESPKYARCVARLLSMLRCNPSGDRFMVDAVRFVSSQFRATPGSQRMPTYATFWTGTMCA